MTDEVVEEQLSSERGRSHTCPCCLIHNEQYQLSDRKFLREHSYVKGEPNLTVNAFAEWIKDTYAETHPESARR